MSPLLHLLFFGVSLQSYYFYNIGMPVVATASLLAMSLVLFASTQEGIRLPLSAPSGVPLAYLVILFWSGVGTLVYDDVPQTKRIIAFAIIILAAVTTITLLRRVPLESLVRAFLVAHLAAFFLQAIVVYTTSYTLDYLAPITGEPQRMRGGAFALPVIGLLPRPTGLFVEPGTYATFIAPLVALFERWYDDSNVNRWVFWLGLLSLVLSLSVFGIVFAAIILLFSRHVRGALRATAAVLGLALAAPYLYYRFVLMPSLGLDTGIGFRQVFLEESFKFLWTDARGFVFGSNLLVLDPRASFAGAFNDIGMIFFFLHFGGPLLTLVIGGALAYVAARSDRITRVALLVLLLSKQSLFAPFFPITLIAIMWPTGDEERELRPSPA